MMRTLVEERKLKRVDDERTLSELLSSIRKRPTSILDSPMCGPSDTSTPTRASSSHRQVHNEFVLDKVNAYWSEGLSPESQQVMGDRFGLEEVHDLANLKEKSLVDVVKEVIDIVQGASLLVVQSDANVKLQENSGQEKKKREWEGDGEGGRLVMKRAVMAYYDIKHLVEENKFF
ncbi:unnamed protein product [Nippostrongylus brasiliensis]|uniref:Abnormal embryogenesis protein 30 (inferred by orthology to a C. elegans protein) n=1 Tax=Nippostrongylus brasiliensis TaxID=27835 RepID=A0A0N4XLT9_NIPBR|nr:unnamed protein product [Nippostrongylus brasiliensis]